MLSFNFEKLGEALTPGSRLGLFSHFEKLGLDEGAQVLFGLEKNLGSSHL